MWLHCIGVVSGRCYKQIYICFLIILLIPNLLVLALFFSCIPISLFILKCILLFIYMYIYTCIYMYVTVEYSLNVFYVEYPARNFKYIYNTQMVAVALGPWVSHSEDRAEP